jgi:peptide/nickel transport system permease protein
MATLEAPAAGTLSDSPRFRSESPTRRALRRLVRHRLAMAGIVVIIVMVLLAVAGSDFRAYDQNLKLGFTNRPPDSQFLLGTDALGRDILSRLLVGGRVSILVALVAVAIATTIGTTVGVAAGYFGGLVDQVLMRFVDMILSFPIILLLIVAAAIVGPGVATLVVIVGLVTWAPAARIVRGQILSLREATFVEAARVIGVTDRRMIFAHILPNVVAPLVVFATFNVATVIIFEASLSYLGIGIQPPDPSWGNMLNAARQINVLERFFWQWIPPAIFIVLMVLSVNFVGDGLRDAFDQRATSGR